MLLFFITSFFLIFHVNCGVVVFFGTYEDATDCTIYTDFTWEQCVIQCNNTLDCYFAYSNPCGICGYGGASKVTFTNDSSDPQIAIKTEVGFNCTEATELLKAGRIDEVKTCQEGFTKYVRDTYTICVQFVNNSGSYLTFNSAQNQCEALNAWIVSPETLDDREIMAAYANNISKLASGIVPAVWIGSSMDSTSTTVSKKSYGYSVYNVLLGSNMSIISIEISFDYLDGSTFCPVAAACGKLIW